MWDHLPGASSPLKAAELELKQSGCHLLTAEWRYRHRRPDPGTDGRERRRHPALYSLFLSLVASGHHASQVTTEVLPQRSDPSTYSFVCTVERPSLTSFSSRCEHTRSPHRTFRRRKKKREPHSHTHTLNHGAHPRLGLRDPAQGSNSLQL